MSRGINMVKVLQVYDSIAVSSGISNVIMSWMRNVDKSQIRMDVLACWKREPDYCVEIEKIGNKVFFIEMEDHIANYHKFIKKVYAFFSKHAGDYDIVHLHSSIFAYPIIFAAKKYGVKCCIIHVHSSTLGNTRKSTLRNIFTLLPMKLSRSQYWACSKEAANVWYERIGVNQYCIINNGIEIRKYVKDESVRKKYRNEWNVDDDTFLLGHISNMSPVKNVPFVIDTASLLISKGYKVKLVLIGKSFLPEEVNLHIKDKKLEEYIINAGGRDDIYNCVQAFDVCLMPSLAEGYGLVPIETQVAKVPTILSEGFPSIVSQLPLSFPLSLSVEKWVEMCERFINKVENIESQYNPSVYYEFDINHIAVDISNRYKQLTGGIK